MRHAPTVPTDPYAFYGDALASLQAAGCDFLVGGAYALGRYTGIVRDTKDLDVFVRPEDQAATLAHLRASGYRTELTYPHWLGKAFCGDHVLDIIFGSGNGVAIVDGLWFRHAVPDHVRGVPVALIPVEEMIWSKAFIMERERYDGADVAHLISAQGTRLNWDRLVRRFGPHWRVLLSHLVLFGFIYPGERAIVPARVMDELQRRLAAERHGPREGEQVCHGTLLSREQYLPDIGPRRYDDARLVPRGALTVREIALWTAAIDGPPPTMEEAGADCRDR
jgi:hypothetical protein